MPVKCNDNYICENDNVTYEDIETLRRTIRSKSRAKSRSKYRTK